MCAVRAGYQLTACSEPLRYRRRQLPTTMRPDRRGHGAAMTRRSTVRHSAMVRNMPPTSATAVCPSRANQPPTGSITAATAKALPTSKRGMAMIHERISVRITPKYGASPSAAHARANQPLSSAPPMVAPTHQLRAMTVALSCSISIYWSVRFILLSMRNDTRSDAASKSGWASAIVREVLRPRE